MKHAFKLWVLLTGLSPLAAQASYGEHERSLNGTGETLRQGGAEVGLATISYGLSDRLMLGLATWPLAFGQASSQLKYKFLLRDNIRLTPYVGGGYDWQAHQGSYGTGATLGFDLGAERRESLSISGGLLHAPPLDLNKPSAPRKQAQNQARVQVEFDHYTQGGNLFYVGALNQSLYAGFTWAWDNFHLGLVSSSAVAFIPLPYLYWRF